MEKGKYKLNWDAWKKWDKSQKWRILTLTTLTLIVLIVLAPIIVYYNIEAGESRSVGSTDNASVKNTKMALVDTLPHVLNSKVGGKEFIGDSVFKRESGIPMLKKEDPKSPPQSTQTAFIQRLSGTQMSQPFDVTEGYNNVKVWVGNKGKQRFTVSISKDSPTGELVSDSVVSIAGGTNWSMYKTTSWESGTYYVNFTSSGPPIKGIAVGRIGARLAELNS